MENQEFKVGDLVELCFGSYSTRVRENGRQARVTGIRSAFRFSAADMEHYAELENPDDESIIHSTWVGNLRLISRANGDPDPQERYEAM